MALGKTKPIEDKSIMSLYEQVKEALKTGSTNLEIARIYGISENLVSKTREITQDYERKENPERFDETGMRL